MPTIVFNLPDGSTQEHDAAEGLSVMEVARMNGIESIVAECGGSLMCATCHVYIDPEWSDRVGAPADDEDGMMDATAAPRQETSRLSCQIKITPELDGLVVTIPETQY